MKQGKSGTKQEKLLSRRLQIALICGICQWLLLLGIQAGNFFAYLLPPIDRDLSAVSYFFTVILFIQAQNALMAALVGVVAYVCAGNVITRWAFFVLYCAESIYLLIDQVYYKVFLDHVRLGAFEGGQQFNATITFGSFTHEIDFVFYLNAVIAIAGAVWLARALLAPQLHPRKSGLPLEIGAVIFLIGIPAYSSKKFGHLNENPVLSLSRDIEEGSVENFLAKQGSGSIAADPGPAGAVDHDPRLPEYLAKLRAKHPRPNLILIVLESVGAENLFQDRGLPSTVFTPNLAQLAAHGVTFDTLYTTFPGTTRSLITLHTGGRQITYSGVAPILRQYEGPLLPRAIGDMGYTTALFSGERLDGEGTDTFLKQAGYQKFYDFAADLLGHDKQNYIHSWGAREEYTQSRVREWLEGLNPSQPFYLEYMNAATHHPYGAPPDFHAPLASADQYGGRKPDYLNALSYTDRSIGTMLDYLDRRGLLKNTVIAITGDHGEAFGDLHSDNYLHKNFTYEENIRDFLILSDGESFATDSGTGIRSSRIGSTGDIMPTLLAVVDAPAPDVPGRNLLTGDFETQIQYFHKLAEPETWGLRDGKWKYIGEIRSGSAQLFDLSTDPTERVNLAKEQPDRVARYAALCRRWYLESDREYTLRVKDYTTVDSRLEASDTRLGARILGLGYLTPDLAFVETAVASPRQAVLAWTKWASTPDSSAICEWISPGGQTLTSKLEAGPEYHVTVSKYPGMLPMEDGLWRVRVREKDGVHLTGKFTVRAAAAPH